MGGMCRERLEVAINTKPVDPIMQLGRSESISPSVKLSGPLRTSPPLILFLCAHQNQKRRTLQDVLVLYGTSI